jgi:putative restriction endonuclease
MPLGDYIEAFRKLRINTANAPRSPHKPIMLLSVIQLFEEGRISENKIQYNQDLLEIYRALFKIVASASDHPNPYFPFFHLKNDGGKLRFWLPVPLPGRELVLQTMDSARSRSAIEENMDFVSLAPELYALLQDPTSRAALKDDLLSHWFPQQRVALESAMTQETQIHAYMRELWQRAEAPESTIPEPTAPLPPEHTRDPAFCRVVREAYDFRCAASGWRILLPDGCPMVEAAHLIPFSETHDDDPRNGIALAPTFHWALDRFLIAPGPDLKWHVSPVLDSRIRDNTELLEFEGKNLLLPKKQKLWPKQEALEWRMQNLLKAI